MSVQNEIEKKIKKAMVLEHVEVINESHMHSVPPNSETHFKCVVVSDEFEGKRSVARHQMVYGLLVSELAGPVHALALHTYSVVEWQQRNQFAPDSPDCLGGSKAD